MIRGVMHYSDKKMKLYYSISEVARMFDLQESTLRYWEKEFPQIHPKKAGRGVRQYRKEDIEIIKRIHLLVKERGMTLEGARKQMKVSPERTARNFELVERLKSIRSELIGMRDALDAFTYQQVDELKENLQHMQP